MRDRLQKAIDDALTVPEFVPGGVILCPEGRTIGSFRGTEVDDEVLDRLCRQPPPCGCDDLLVKEDLLILWHQPKKAPTHMAIDIADLQALLRPTARIAKTTLCCDRSHENSPVHWNEFNGVVQCHACGAVYEPLHP